jgi:hypothetical protein
VSRVRASGASAAMPPVGQGPHFHRWAGGSSTATSPRGRVRSLGFAISALVLQPRSWPFCGCRRAGGHGLRNELDAYSSTSDQAQP